MLQSFLTEHNLKLKTRPSNSLTPSSVFLFFDYCSDIIYLARNVISVAMWSLPYIIMPLLKEQFDPGCTVCHSVTFCIDIHKKMNFPFVPNGKLMVFKWPNI